MIPMIPWYGLKIFHLTADSNIILVNHYALLETY